jgi:hypothetical protein
MPAALEPDACVAERLTGLGERLRPVEERNLDVLHAASMTGSTTTSVFSELAM